MSSIVSGTYRGLQTSPNTGKFSINLRLDVDRIREHSIVTHTLSGDFIKNSSGSRSYMYSWVAKTLKIEEHPQHVTVSGAVQTTHHSSRVESVNVRINFTHVSSDTSAIVTFKKHSGSESVYQCERESEWFREAKLEVDVCTSIRPPGIRLPKGILPDYDTHSVSTRPATLSRRTLSPVTSFADAGIELSIAKTSTLIDDSAQRFRKWSNAELHATMISHFKQLRTGSGSWPKWHMWGLVAGRHDNDLNRGMMFDASTSGTGPRQGFAVFVDHPELRSSFARNGSGIDAVARRMLLRVMVHEAAHTFNLRHPEGMELTWMNRPHVFDSAAAGSTTYWENFPFSFTREELIHLRHGEFRSVCMGGNFTAPELADASSFWQTPEVISRPRWRIDIRSPGFFDLLEPIEIELRVKNCSRTKSVTIDGPLQPEFGHTIVLIKRPDGSVVQYKPLACYCRGADAGSKLLLAPCKAGKQGEDRISQLLDLTSGSSGFIFDAPGNYEIRVVYHSSDQVATSEVHRIRVGYPVSRRIDVLAQDYFSADNALSLALGVSRARSLSSSFRLLETIVHCESPYSEMSQGVVTKLACRMGKSLGRPFHERVGRGRSQKFRVTAEEKTTEAIQLIESTLRRYKDMSRKARKTHNLHYEDAAMIGIEIAKNCGDQDYVTTASKDLLATLKANGVRAPVLKRVRARLRKMVTNGVN